MNTLKTTPEQILTLWEKNFQKLSPKHQRDFLEHPTTEILCNYKLIQIEGAIVLGYARYLPKILKSIHKYSKITRRDISEHHEFHRRESAHHEAMADWRAKIGDVKFAPKRPVLVPNPNTSKYDRYICASRVTQGRKDECRCRVAA